MKSPFRISVFLLLLLPASAAPARPPSRPSIPFAADDRLQKRVTLHDRLISLEEGLAEVGKATGVSLRAEPRVAGENVVLLVRDKPAAELLEVVATTLGYRWRKLERDRPRPAYEVYQDEAGWREEARLHTERRALGLALLEKQLRDKVALARGETPEAVDPFQDLNKLLTAPGTSLGDQARLQREISAHAPPNDAKQAALFEIALQLWPRLREPILTGGSVNFSSAQEPGMEQLPPAAVRTLCDGYLRFIEHVKKFRAENNISQPAAAPELIARFSSGRDLPAIRVWFHAHWTLDTASLGAADDLLGVTDDQLSERGLPGGILVPLPPVPPGDLPPVESSDERLANKVHVVFPQKHPDSRDASTLAFQPIPADLLDVLHEQQPEVNFVGDSYRRRLSLLAATRSGGSEARLARGPDAVLLDLLNQVARGERSRWEWDPRGYACFRRRIAYDERPRAIPATLLRELARRSERREGLVLGDYVWLAGRLTDAQIEELDEGRPLTPLNLPRESCEAYCLSAGRDDLRLLATLNQAQLRALGSGEELPVGQLAPPQRRLVQGTLNRPTNLGYAPGAFIAWTDQRVSATTLRIGKDEGSGRRQLDHLLPGREAPIISVPLPRPWLNAPPPAPALGTHAATNSPP